MTSSNLNCLFCNNIFHYKGQIGQNMSSKIYNILRQYHICIKFDNQRKAKCCKILMSSFFVVWHVYEIFEPKLAYFHKYLSMEMMNKTE